MKHFVGRKNTAKYLESVLRGDTKSKFGALTVLSIEGPGGVGKTSFFEHVRDGLNLDFRKFLVMRIGGNGDSRKSVLHAIRTLIESAHNKELPQKPAGFYFPTLTAALGEYEQILREAQEEYAKSATEGDTAAEMVMSAIDVLVGLGKPINKLIPKTQDFLDLEELGKHREGIGNALKKLSTLQTSETGWLEKLGWDSAATLRNALKNNPLQVFGQCMVSDLTAILSGYEGQDFFRPKIPKIECVDRLLLVVDDYEVVKSSLERLFVDHLFIALKNAKFETTAVIVGRDCLADTANGDWDRQLGGVLLDPVSLFALTREEMKDLANLHGIHDDSEQLRAWNDTEGYPFFVQLWLEENQSGGRGAMLLKRAYDRTTKWMDEEQRRWLAYSLVIKPVDKRQFKLVLRDEAEAERAFAWFVGDASIRDPKGETFRVREYLRSRLLDYIKLSDPDFYGKLIGGSAAVNADN